MLENRPYLFFVGFLQIHLLKQDLSLCIQSATNKGTSELHKQHWNAAIRDQTTIDRLFKEASVTRHVEELLGKSYSVESAIATID